MFDLLDLIRKLLSQIIIGVRIIRWFGLIRSVCTVDPGVPPERGAHLDRGVATPRSRCREVRHSSREFLKENPRFLFIIVFESNEAMT